MNEFIISCGTSNILSNFQKHRRLSEALLPTRCQRNFVPLLVLFPPPGCASGMLGGGGGILLALGRSGGGSGMLPGTCLGVPSPSYGSLSNRLPSGTNSIFPKLSSCLDRSTSGSGRRAGGFCPWSQLLRREASSRARGVSAGEEGGERP